MMNVAHVLIFFIEMLISCVFFGNLVDRKTSMPITILIGLVLFEIGAFVNIYLISTVWLNILISVIVNITFTLICFRIRPFKGIFYSIILVAISSLLEIVIVFLLSSVTHHYVSNYENEPIFIIVGVCISKIIYFIIALILSKFITKDSKYVSIPLTCYFYPIISVVIIVALWYISVEENITYRHQVIHSFAGIILLLATILNFFSYQYRVQREHKLITLQQENEKNETDFVYYAVLEEQNNNLRTYAHDAKNHLIAIQNLNTDPQIENYLSKLLERLADYSNVCHSGNRILDVIINKYITECRLKEILFKFDIKNNNLNKLEYYDIVTILTNLLDNAVESSVNSNNKQISIETDYRNNFSVIIITNSCDQAPDFNASLIPKTTKENKQLHGFGIRSVKKTLKKYNGDIAFEYDSNNKLFSVTIMFETQSI